MVVSTGMFHMLKDPVQMLRECYRVLNTGGDALIYDPAQVSSKIDKRRRKASLLPLERRLSIDSLSCIQYQVKIHDLSINSKHLASFDAVRSIVNQGIP